MKSGQISGSDSLWFLLDDKLLLFCVMMSFFESKTAEQ